MFEYIAYMSTLDDGLKNGQTSQAENYFFLLQLATYVRVILQMREGNSSLPGMLANQIERR